jgi:hypothetical protein
MPFDYETLRQKLVHHLIALEVLDPEYAVWALDQYRRDPSGVYRDLLAEVKAERARRAADLPPALSKPTETPSSPTPGA